jgi:hypothetical protein
LIPHSFPVLAADRPIISTVAGGGPPAGYCGDGDPAISACLNFPIGHLEVEAIDSGAGKNDLAAVKRLF